MIPHFTLHRPDADVAVPLIIHVPHASDFVPPHCRGDFALPDGELGAVIAAMIDHDTDRLALAAVPLGAHVFVNNVCRLVMDPERHADDAVEVAAGWGMGAIYVDTHDGRRLRRADWTDRDRAARLDEFHQPYHRAIRDLVLELRDRFAAPVHIIDLHSFPEQPLPYETDRGPRPRYCLGYTERHVPLDWVAWWEARAADSPDLLAHNRPFAGSFVPEGLDGGLDRDATWVRSLMVEVNRSLLPGYPGRGPLPDAHARAGLVRAFLEFACEELSRDLRRRKSAVASVSERSWP